MSAISSGGGFSKLLAILAKSVPSNVCLLRLAFSRPDSDFCFSDDLDLLLVSGLAGTHTYTQHEVIILCNVKHIRS